MTVAIRHQSLTLDDAVQQGVAAAVDGHGVAETAALLWAEGLDADAIDSCGVVGLRTLIHARLAVGRQPGSEDEGAADGAAENEVLPGRPVANRNYAKEHWLRVLSANYEAADGSRKSVLAFTPEDVLHLRFIAHNRAEGYMRLREAMDTAAALLKKHRKQIVSDLPEKAQRQIAEVLA